MTQTNPVATPAPELARGDLIDELLAILPGDALDGIRAARPEARRNAQLSYEALLHPADASEASPGERHLVAQFVTGISREPRLTDWYRAGSGQPALAAEIDALIAEVLEAGTSGPVGHYREPGLAAESTPGTTLTLGEDRARRLGARLTAAIEHAHLLVFRPRESSPAALQALLDAGWSTTGVVTLSQLIAFITFQLRLLIGLAALDGQPKPEGQVLEAIALGDAGTVPAGEPAAITERVLEVPEIERPERFTQESLGWVPWLAPLPEAEFEDRHWRGLVQPERAKMPYFALLARDPEVLLARTRTDLDIFFNEDGGAPRAERELAAAATSRVNGCVFCASVHARAAAQLSGRQTEVQRLLDEGVSASLDPRWDAVVAASVSLTETPAAFGAVEIAGLRAQGLDAAQIADVISGAAFFNWANRLMLSLGEPRFPARRRP